MIPAFSPVATSSIVLPANSPYRKTSEMPFWAKRTSATVSPVPGASAPCASTMSHPDEPTGQHSVNHPVQLHPPRIADHEQQHELRLRPARQCAHHHGSE